MFMEYINIMKKLSVISVTYNCAQLIRETISSVLKQSSDFVEYIVIDGGSVDGTIDIIDEYKDDIAYFISEPDQGIYSAMNKGIREASAEWILFLNAGDIFHDNFQVSNLNFNWPKGTEFVAFPFMIGGDDEIKIPQFNTKFGMPSSHQAMLVAAYSAKSIALNEKYHVASDYDFFLRRYMLNRECVCIENAVISVVRPGGYSEQNIDVMRREYQEIIFNQLGLKKVIIYFIWSRPKLFRLVKLMTPISIFKVLKINFMRL